LRRIDKKDYSEVDTALDPTAKQGVITNNVRRRLEDPRKEGEKNINFFKNGSPPLGTRAPGEQPGKKEKIKGTQKRGKRREKKGHLFFIGRPSREKTLPRRGDGFKGGVWDVRAELP